MKFERLVAYVRTAFYEEYLLKEEHSVSCISSCYKCLRNYENRIVHANLDWRLAIDLLDIYLGQHQARISLGDHWESVIDRAAQLIENVIRADTISARTEHGVVYSFSVRQRSVGLLPEASVVARGRAIKSMQFSKCATSSLWMTCAR